MFRFFTNSNNTGKVVGAFYATVFVGSGYVRHVKTMEEVEELQKKNPGCKIEWKNIHIPGTIGGMKPYVVPKEEEIHDDANQHSVS